MVKIIIGAFLGGIIAELLWAFVLEPAMKKADKKETERFINSLKLYQGNKKNQKNKSKKRVYHQA